MKVVLSIAGSDSSGGAGIQADLKTFEAFGVFGCSVITVLTAQNTTGVSSLYEVSTEFVEEQIDAVLSDFDVSAIKIGMLYSTKIIKSVKKKIESLDLPIVLDPVSISKAGSNLLSADAVKGLRELFPYASLITPNEFELKKFFGSEIDTSKVPVLAKNQTVDGTKCDVLYKDAQKSIFPSKYIQSNNTHGTGCSFSSAIAANLALGKNLEEAIKVSKSFISDAIVYAPNIGNGKGPILHNQRLKNV